MRRNEDAPRMLGRLLDELKRSKQDIAVDYKERRRSEAEIEAKNVVMQLAARLRDSPGNAIGTIDGPPQ